MPRGRGLVWGPSSGARAVCRHRPPTLVRPATRKVQERGGTMDDRRDASRDGIDRRSFLKYSAVAGAAASAIPAFGIAGAPNAAAATAAPGDSFRWNEATIAELQAAM